MSPSFRTLGFEAQKIFVDPKATQLMIRFVLIKKRKLRKLTRGVQEK